jgi:ATP synthase protein I
LLLWAVLSIIRRARKGRWLFLGQRVCGAKNPGRYVNQPRPMVDRSQALLLLKWQLILAVILSAVACYAGESAVLSVALGCVIAMAGSLYFALQAFRHAGAISAPQIVQSFYKGEAGKFVITALLFAAVFAWVKSVLPGWLLSGFILEQLVVAWGVLLAGTTRPKL